VSPKSVVDLCDYQAHSDWMSQLHTGQMRYGIYQKVELTPASSIVQSSQPTFLTMRIRTQNLAARIITVMMVAMIVVASRPGDAF